MKMLRHVLFIMIVFAATIAAKASVTFSVNPPGNVVAGQQFQVTFSLSADGERLKEDASFTPPEIKGCKLIYGPGIGTQTVSINGRVSMTRTYTYMYMAGAKGKVDLPAVSATYDGQKFSTRKYTFEILPDASLSNRRNNSSAQQSQGSASGQSSASGKVSASDLMVHIHFSKADTYEQEAVIATIKLYVAYDRNFDIDGGAFRIISQPVFEGFLSEDLPTAQKSKLENYNGSNYETVELKKVLLFPQKAGQLKVQSGEYQIDIVEYEQIRTMMGIQRRQIPRSITTRPNTASLKVLSLPEPKPAGFNGAVGQYKIQTSLSPEIIKTNEAATYSLIISGTGNVKYLTIPDITMPSTFDKYTAKTEIDAKFNGSTYTGTYKVNYPFVAQEVGKYEIPTQKFVYFDTSTRKYVTLDTRSYDVNVARGTAAAPTGAQKQVGEMNDILHIHQTQRNTSAASTPIADKGWYWSLYVLIVLAVCGAYSYKLISDKKNADVAGRRTARAGKEAKRRLRTAAKMMKNHDNTNFYAELARAIKGYLSDKLGIPQSQLITDTISSRLEQMGVDDETIKQISDVLLECEMARFTPQNSDEAINDIFDRATKAINSIESSK